MEYISCREYSELKGCSVRYAQMQISKGAVTAVEQCGNNNCLQYMIPVTSLPPELQQKHYSRVRGESTALLPAPPKQSGRIQCDGGRIQCDSGRIPPHRERNREFGSFTAFEREQITFWCDILNEWRIRRKEYDSCEIGDTVYIEEVKRLHRQELEKFNIRLSRDILYRKYRFYMENDLAGLTECRGGSNKGNNHIPPELSKVFCDLWLRDSEPGVSECFRLTREWAVVNRPDLLDVMPSEMTFRRMTKNIPIAVIKFFRGSEKECYDDCLAHIIRLYDDIEANDVWVADNHTFDFITRSEDGERLHRMYITGFLDAKTGALVGWNITENPCSQSTILALRHGIMRCGVPKIVYVDNGREFLTHDIGGKGHRARKSQEDVTDPPTILDRLGIKMKNALVCNGRAKPIERMFLTLKNTISRLMTTFTGGNIIERPESLKWHIKHGVVPWDTELKEKLDILLDGYNGSLYGGCEPQFKGLTRAEAWCRSIKRRKVMTCDESTLDFLLMRNTRFQKVRENGVYITVSGEKLYYNCGEDNWKYQEKKVYVRYDPADLEYVRVYDEEDRFIGDWALDRNVFVDYIVSDSESCDDIADRQRLIGRQLRAIKACGKDLSGDMQIDALALAVSEANRKLGDVTFTLPDSTECLAVPELRERITEESCEEVDIDLKLMGQNAERRKSG